MTSIRETLRAAAHSIPHPARPTIGHVRVRSRRWRLLRAYMRVAHQRRTGNERTSVRGGFINHMIAIEQLEQDGLIRLTNTGEVEWLWPDN